MIERCGPAGEGGARLAHLRDCASCRRQLADQDPSRLFGLLALAPIPESAFAELEARLERRLAVARAAPPRRLWVA
ncbi:MAG TPA: hypothetical protein VJS92_09650, partial [Candidatus Polarisedimenticolaceae bacterium]|nr:hypothetical protein [Candidatus Polarisedimenticolaceae bacterium]